MNLAGFRPLFGLSVVVSKMLCDGPRFVRWRRKHRKKRINKKWQKKYGAVVEQCKGKGHVVDVGNGPVVYLCPHAKAKFDREIAEANNAKRS